MNQTDRTLARCLSAIAADVRNLQIATLSTGASLPPSLTLLAQQSLANFLQAGELLDFAEGAAEQLGLDDEPESFAGEQQPFGCRQQNGHATAQNDANSSPATSLRRSSPSPWLAAAVATADRVAAAGVHLDFGRSPLVDAPQIEWDCPLNLVCSESPCPRADWCAQQSRRSPGPSAGDGQHDADRQDGGLHSEPLPTDYPPSPPRSKCPKGATCMSEPCPWLDYCRSSTAQQPIATEVHCPQDGRRCGAECIWRTHCGLMAGGHTS